MCSELSPVRCYPHLRYVSLSDNYEFQYGPGNYLINSPVIDSS